ncbi:MAG: hypothetical protein AMJ42_04575 [Deltaproteobacteria bacterium DG_8]|nr:MAG: hypothetical protein AMJ42_04575 [Deltaproteobacteria bacterium DG_8]
MPKIRIDGEKWKYKNGTSNVVIISPDGEEFIASHEEITCEDDCYVTKDDVREYIERELL